MVFITRKYLKNTFSSQAKLCTLCNTPKIIFHICTQIHATCNTPTYTQCPYKTHDTQNAHSMQYTIHTHTHNTLQTRFPTFLNHQRDRVMSITRECSLFLNRQLTRVKRTKRIKHMCKSPEHPTSLSIKQNETLFVVIPKIAWAGT